MNPSFINRLVGTTIVVIAAVVFIPNILDGEKVQKTEVFKTIPERPSFTGETVHREMTSQTISEQLPTTPVIEEEAIDLTTQQDEQQIPVEKIVVEQASNEVVTDDSEVENIANQVEDSQLSPKVNEIKPAEKVVEKVAIRKPESNLNEFAYVIQLGSFSHKANVEALLKKLKDGGFTAFTQPIKTPSGWLTKVFVGPDLDKDKLQSQLPSLKKLTKLDGKVTQFEIAK